MALSPVLNLISSLFKPAVELIDKLHTSDEERIDAKTRMLTAQTDVTMKILDYEAQLTQMKSSIVLAEAQGDSVLQRNWRPITMLTFLCLVVAESMGWLHQPLHNEMWTLLQIGLGGYVVGRSAEKIAPVLKAFGGKSG